MKEISVFLQEVKELVPPGFGEYINPQTTVEEVAHYRDELVETVVSLLGDEFKVHEWIYDACGVNGETTLEDIFDMSEKYDQDEDETSDAWY
jgi:hypothetical protein